MMNLVRWLWVPALVLLLTVGDITVYRVVARSLQRRTDRQLNDVAMNVSRSVQESHQPSGVVQISLPDLDSFATEGSFVQILDKSGHGLRRSAEPGNDYLPAPTDALNATCSTQPDYYDTTFGDQAVRVLSTPLLETPCTVLGSIQVVSLLRDAHHDLAVLREVLVGFGGAEIVLLVGGIWWLRRPDERMGQDTTPASVAA